MKNFVLGAIVGALVGAAIGYVMWGQQVNALQTRVDQLEAKLNAIPPVTTTGTGNPHIAVIVLQGGQGEDCKAKVNPFLIGNKRNNKVYWDVDFEDSQCQNGNGNWHIELRFDADPTGPAWNNGTVNVKRQGISPWKIPNTANYGKFPYHVWMVGTREYEMADPELQIEM